MPSLRIALHALDRTGPARLARSLTSWLAEHRPDLPFDVVAFRGGDLETEFAAIAPVRVLLDDGEAWDHGCPAPERVAAISGALAHLEPAEVVVLVSVAAGQVLDHLPEDGATVVAWVVEQGEDLHWLDPPVSVRERVDVWLAGSEGTRRALVGRLDPDAEVSVTYEFVDDVAPAPPAPAGTVPTPDGRILVVGAGIGTYRKAPDLFLEIAASLLARGRVDARFVWIGGERDPLVPLVRSEVERLGLTGVELVDNTPHLGAWLDAADLLVHPARLDAFPLVCLEAALLGTPVVAFDGVGGVPEMFGPTFCGVPYPDTGGIVRTVEGLLSTAALTELGARQRAHVASRYVSSVAAPAFVAELTRRVPDHTGLRP